MTVKLMICGLIAALTLGVGADAQSAIDKCAGEDSVSVKACLARVLSERETELDAKRDELRTAARLFVSSERRRNAIARVSATATAWRALRDQDCALTAALAPEAFDPGSLQILCAIDATEVRLARLDDLIAAAVSTAEIDRRAAAAQGETSPAESVLDPIAGEAEAAPDKVGADDMEAAPPPAETNASSAVAPRAVAGAPNAGASVAASDAATDRAYFRDWLASCDAQGACSAVSHMFAGETAGAYGAAHVLRLSRAAGGESDWTLTLTTVASPADPDAPLTLQIDDAPALAFTPRREYAAVGGADDLRLLSEDKAAEAMALMKSGYRAVFGFTAREGAPGQARFSLLGLTAAMQWIDQRQGRAAAPLTVSDAAAGASE